MNKKCHNCNGKGQVQPKLNNEQLKKRKQEEVRVSICGYCHGKGWRDTNYGIDKSKQ